jgi:hypothetical protein
MNTYTVFCKEKSGEGTTWIDAVQATSMDLAKLIALERCAKDWSWDQEDIEVIGVAAGDVQILEWDNNEDN